LTVAENIAFTAGMYGLSDDHTRQRLAALSDRLHLGAVQDRLARTLSTGWRQRLALAASIVHEPPLVFLDEPTSGVDPVTRRLFWEVIDDLANAGTTVFVTTHVMDEAEHCTELAMMHYGRIIAQGTPEQMRTEHVRGMVEVQTTELWLALETLKAAEAVQEVALFGEALHVECRPQVADPATLVSSLLAEAGLSAQSVRAVTPTMEDVFVSLARQYGRPDEEGGR
jgi:ABC-2 type transport system ATP-binding protein